jgi:putative ABC transport system substrate-binding protein
MQRRQFIAGLGSAATWPVVARAQQPALPVVGLLLTQSADHYKIDIVAFLQSLKEAGFFAGQDVTVEYRHADNHYDRLPALAADLVRRRVAVIVAEGNTPALAAKAATRTIPIVFTAGSDPVTVGLVASLNRPGANVTGITSLTADLSQKRLQLLRELLPNAAVFGVLVEDATAVAATITALKAAARTLGVQLVIANARTDSDLETAFATFSQQHVGGALTGPSSFYDRRREQLVALAARHALPAVCARNEFALAGGLMSHGSSIGYAYHLASIPGAFSKATSRPT